MERTRYYLDTTFSLSLDIGKAVKYLNSGEIPLRDATEIALASFYCPLAAAQEGASVRQVEALIEVSRTQFETYMSLAVSRSQKQLELDSERNAPDVENFKKENKSQEIEGIKFEDEEL